jgi:hypothetical protein
MTDSTHPLMQKPIPSLPVEFLGCHNSPPRVGAEGYSGIRRQKPLGCAFVYHSDLVHFTLCPPLATQRPVPPSMSLCGASSPIVILSCTLLSPLLCPLIPSLIPVHGNCQPADPGCSSQPFKRSQSAPSRRTLPRSRSHSMAHDCSVSIAGTRGLTWTPSQSTRVSACLTATSSTITL